MRAVQLFVAGFRASTAEVSSSQAGDAGKILAKGAGEMPLGFEGFDVQGISRASLPCYRLANTSGFLSMSES